MKFFFVFILLIIAPLCFSQKEKPTKLKNGAWISELKLTDSDILPFHMKVKKGRTITVINAEEEIVLNPMRIVGDSVHVSFPYFNSELVFSIKNKKQLEGYWVNFNKSADYKIPFSSKREKSHRFSSVSKKTMASNVNGKWKVTFEPNTPSAYPAVGIFKQKEDENKVSGTFLTETGDYRFLEGNCTEDSLFLSCFDGSHAFLFKAHKSKDSLHGKFFSGSHWQSDWNGEKNESYQLTSPDKLTYIVDTNALNFQLKNLKGETFSYPNQAYTNKVVIIQIMGSWCPNCLDETHYYKELYDKYHSQGLEIISIGYETGKGFEDYAANISRLKEKLGLEFNFLVGGAANKGLASEHFKMLNEVISFPTSIFIGKDGDVKRVHTGFNGPGTGAYYTEYVEKTNALVESLLNQ